VNRAVIRYLLLYGVGVGLLAWVVAAYWHNPGPDGQDLGLAGALQRPLALRYLWVAGALFVVAILITFVRWYILVRALDLPFTLRHAFRLGVIGYFWSALLPGSITGDVIKAAFLARDQKRRTVAISSVLVDRVIGMAALFSLALITGVTMWSLGVLDVLHEDVLLLFQAVYTGTLCVVLFLAGFWVAARLLPDSWGERGAQWLARFWLIGGSLAEFWRAAWMYRGQAGALVLALLMSVCGHALQALAFYFAARTVLPAAEVPTLAQHFVLLPVAFTIQAGMPTPGGVGMGEAALGKLYEWFGATGAAGVLASLAYRVIGWTCALVGLLTYWRLHVQSQPAALPPAAAEVSPAASGHLP
jgi:uncharacterized protein (TIRG00374 family)